MKRFTSKRLSGEMISTCEDGWAIELPPTNVTHPIRLDCPLQISSGAVGPRTNKGGGLSEGKASWRIVRRVSLTLTFPRTQAMTSLCLSSWLSCQPDSFSVLGAFSFERRVSVCVAMRVFP